MQNILTTRLDSSSCNSVGLGRCNRILCIRCVLLILVKRPFHTITSAVFDGLKMRQNAMSLQPARRHYNREM